MKHGEQKEAFLKACTLARRTAETFLKYAARSAQVHGQTAAASKAHHEQTRAILDTLLAQENKVRGNSPLAMFTNRQNDYYLNTGAGVVARRLRCVCPTHL